MEASKKLSKEEILDWEYTNQTEGITALMLVSRTFPSETRDIALSAMDRYASHWQQKYNDLKARFDQMDADTTKASGDMKEAYERLHKEYEEVKEKAGKMQILINEIAKYYDPIKQWVHVFKPVIKKALDLSTTSKEVEK